MSAPEAVTRMIAQIYCAILHSLMCIVLVLQCNAYENITPTADKKEKKNPENS